MIYYYYIYNRKGGIAVDNMQARIEMVIYFINVLKDFINIVLDFLPKRKSESNALSDGDSFGSDR